MPRFLLAHSHAPDSCTVAFAAWRGYSSPLRHKPALSDCLLNGHRLWWVVEAIDTNEALGLLPEFLASTTEVYEVSEVPIP